MARTTGSRSTRSQPATALTAILEAHITARIARVNRLRGHIGSDVAAIEARLAIVRRRRMAVEAHHAALRQYLHSLARKIAAANIERRAKGQKLVDGKAVMARLAQYVKANGGRLPLGLRTVAALRQAHGRAVMTRPNGGVPVPRGQRVCLKVVSSGVGKLSEGQTG